MSLPAIKVESLWKQYTVGAAQQRHSTFYDLLAHSIKAPFSRLRSLGGEAEEAEQFWALRDVSFDIQPGEVVGVIGRNGAGKSTLLKILSRITAPTRGRIEVRGRLASLLEVGTGFHPELSGRENIFLNGAILGMSRAEVARKFDDIVSFAEVEKFIDTPVKRYSSGMYVRLAFAVAAHLDVDVLVVDEVLAVGDAKFQDKCLAKMGNLSGGGRSILLVSHNQSALARLCTRGIVMSEGQAVFAGGISEALHAYSRANRSKEQLAGAVLTGPMAEYLKLSSIAVNEETSALKEPVSPSESIEILTRCEVSRNLRLFRVTYLILKDGQTILGLHDAVCPNDQKYGEFHSMVSIPPLTLPPGDYIIDVHAYTHDTGDWMVARNAAEFSVAMEWHPLYEPTNTMGYVNLPIVGKR